jgi:serine protease Do
MMKLIGINSAIYGEERRIVAIPINKTKRAVDDLITCKINPAWVGITLQTLSPEMANYLGYTGESGVLVKDTEPKSPAEKGGMQKTDIIIKIENDT